MSDNEQKYFVGNWVKAKNNEWSGIIIDLMSSDPEEYIIGFLGKGVLYMLKEQLDNEAEVVPYPWQLFFKVGDKVKIVGVPNSGIITKISTFAESPEPLYVRTESAGGKEYIDVYAPHELIKVGEA